MPGRRGIIAAAVLVALLVAIEVGVRQWWMRPKACLEIKNEGATAMEALVVVYGQTRMPAGRIPPGESLRVWVTAGPPGPLRLEFRQKGNGMQGFEIPDYDPRQNIQDAYKMVLAVSTNQFQRYVEDDETRAQESLGSRLLRWFESDLNSP